MKPNIFESLYADAVKKHPRHFSFGEPPSSIEVVEDAARKLNVRFPSAYRTFLITHGSGEIAFALVYSPDPASYWDIVKQNAKRNVSEEFYAFSDDQCGNYFGFSRKGGENVYIYDHEKGGWGISEYADFYEYFADLSFRD